jgi:cell division septation protein DedD
MRITFFAMVIVSLIMLVNATVWEGVTEADSAGVVPGNYSVATNSFPRNTVVDITNLENGKMVRVKVVSGLEQAGLLAMLSRTAAESIDLHGNSSGRIRMTQPSDDIAFSLFNLGPIGSTASRADDNAVKIAEAIAERDARADDNAVKRAEIAAERAAIADNPAVHGGYFNGVAGGQTPATDNSALPNNSPYNSPYNSAYNSPYNSPYNSVTPPADSNPASILLSPIIAPIPEAPAETAGHYNEPGVIYGRLTLVPSEERIPTATGYIITPENIIPSIGTNVAAQSEAVYAPPIVATLPEASSVPSVEFSPFQAPLISRLERNKWYVQVALYGKAEYVEDEISRIGTGYPLAVQNVGTDTNPLFRVLLGPLNQGESGAMLQRFKSLGYTDAFVRHN